jgi:uncharacterized protein with PIN domain
MLRGLARWLRFLGYRSFVIENLQQLNQLFINHPNAVFITQSRKKIQTIDPQNALFMVENNLEKQLVILNAQYKIFENIELLSLCSLCNIPTTPVEKRTIKGKIPPAIWSSHDCFWICSRCQKIYWKGGHTKRLIDKLKRLNVPI